MSGRTEQAEIKRILFSIIHKSLDVIHEIDEFLPDDDGDGDGLKSEILVQLDDALDLLYDLQEALGMKDIG